MFNIPTMRTPACDKHPALIPYASLYPLLQRAAPRYIRCDVGRKKILFDTTQDDLDDLESSADCVLTTFPSGLRAIDILMICCDRREIPDSAWRELGDLIAMLSETQLALANLQQTARSGEPAAPPDKS